ncbi:MAG: ABC transporter ATP-binding protein [Proteobacteria bacterium]|nr:ABC transporter ATP-binding protein [Pseudomonadota bacterium]MDA1059154.1 ABC transporter ATP-binding protein [Pseudomonadota bacterium]
MGTPQGKTQVIDAPSRGNPNTAAGTEPIISLQGVSCRFGDVVAVDAVDLRVDRGEFFSLLGASGCGKTTLLRLIAGLEQPDTGRILLDGEEMAGIPAYRRPVNTVFQSYALFPHMTVARNVAFGLRQENLPRAEIAQRVVETLALFSIEGLAKRKPAELSGGQRQRVALCRALVKRPKILLLDEPLAALDRRLRERARFELSAVQARLGITFVMVTHDQEEAMSLSTRVAVMDAGRIVQQDEPRAIYDRPVNRFVAGFVGDANLIDGTVSQVSGGAIGVDAGLGVDVAAAHAAGIAPGDPVSVMIRPERIRLVTGASDSGGVTGRVRGKAFLGNAWVIQVVVAGERLIDVRLIGEESGAGLSPGHLVTLSWPAEAAVCFAREIGV